LRRRKMSKTKRILFWRSQKAELSQWMSDETRNTILVRLEGSNQTEHWFFIEGSIETITPEEAEEAVDFAFDQHMKQVQERAKLEQRWATHKEEALLTKEKN
jgi:hypothetical protein